jgi:hydroxysqualene dehydroxylase
VHGTFDAIVIGGGFAGLAAATALVEANARVLVVEARRQLGGRASTFRDPQTGERIDNGQHVLAGCYDETRRFLARIGAGRVLHEPSALSVSMIEEDNRRFELRLPPLPSPLHLFAGVVACGSLTWEERLSIIRVGPYLRRSAADHASPGHVETVREWLRRHRQSPRLCRLLWEPLALATLNQSIDRASARLFLAVIGRMLGGGAERSTLLLPSVLLDDLYAEPARRFLSANGSIVATGISARIRFGENGVEGVSGGLDVAQSAIVIAAVPWFAFEDLFEAVPPALHDIANRCRSLLSSPIVTVNVWFDRRVMTDDFVGLPGRAFQWVFDKSRIVGNGLSHLSMVSSGADDIIALPNDAVSSLAIHELRQALPAARVARLRRVSIVRERRATFSLSPGMPARPGTVTAIEGLFLAGDWIETGLPATIESAVVAGHAAAREACSLLSRTTKKSR